MAPISRRQFGLNAAATLAGAATINASATSAMAAEGQRLPSAREVPWLAAVQRPPKPAPVDPNAPPPQEAPPAAPPPLRPLLVDSGRNPIRTRVHWEQHREYLHRQWLDLAGMFRPEGQLLDKAPKRPPTFEIRQSDRSAGVSRRLIRYEAERGVEVEAYLLTPLKTRDRNPGVVLFHSTVDYTIRQGAGLEGPAEAAWGIKLAQRGMVVLCPRCFLWNDKPKDFDARVREHQRRHPLSRGIAKMLFDGQRAVDLLASLDEVDPKRIGTAGHSLGAKEALYLGALDERIRATVSSEGGIGLRFSNWDAPWYWGTNEFFGRDHHELVAMIAPRSFLLIGGSSADGDQSWPYIEAAMPVYKFYGEPCHLGLYNHGRGHTVPPLAEQRVYEWLQAYL